MSIIEGTKQAATDRLRVIAGPAYRRVKREIQWRRCGADLALERGPVSGFPWVVMAHETPLIRPLSGLEHRLQVNKVTNLRLAIDPSMGECCSRASGSRSGGLCGRRRPAEASSKDWCSARDDSPQGSAAACANSPTSSIG